MGTTGLLLMLYQHLVFGVPFLPGERKTVWNVETKIEFQPTHQEQTRVRLALPAVQVGYTQIHQDTTGSGYDVSFAREKHSGFVQWSGDASSSGTHVLRYRTDFLRDPGAALSSITVAPLEEPAEPEPYASAMRSIADKAAAQGADPLTAATGVIQELGKENDTTLMLLERYGRNQLVVRILAYCGISARVVGVLSLEDKQRNQKLKHRVAVFNGATYHILDSRTAGTGHSDHEIIWNGNGEPLLDIAGGTGARVSFSTHRNTTSAIAEARRLAMEEHNPAPSVSLAIGGLPAEEQRLFRSFLLLPIGVLIAVFLRIIVGIRTIGTFMPALIAMSFLQTTLPVGLVVFLVLVGLGLVIRGWLSHLHLLQISRISAVIIVVIAIVILLTLLAHRTGLADQLRLTFFPIVILSWTIERMSVLWEEGGGREVLRQGGGSLLVAICGYYAMDCALVEHITTNFFGLQLVLLSLVLLMGRYTGYRFSELRRFAPLARQIRTTPNGNQDEPEALRLREELSRLRADPGKTSRSWKAQCGDQQER